jgi:hypothetical protein
LKGARGGGAGNELQGPVGGPMVCQVLEQLA